MATCADPALRTSGRCRAARLPWLRGRPRERVLAAVGPAPATAQSTLPRRVPKHSRDLAKGPAIIVRRCHA